MMIFKYLSRPAGASIIKVIKKKEVELYGIAGNIGFYESGEGNERKFSYAPVYA